MKKSIKMNMFFVLIGLILTMVLLYYITNVVFLKKYYTYKKISFMTSTYGHLKELYISDKQKFDSEIERITYESNVNILLFPFEEEQNKKLPRGLLALTRQAWMQRGNVIRKTQSYTVRRISLEKLSTEMILFTGDLNDREKIIIILPVSSIKDSVDIFNEFLLFVALVAIIIGSGISIIVAKRLSKPVLDIFQMSENMKKLDFAGRYKGNREDEIQNLGENMNALSGILDSTITELKSKNNQLDLDIHQKDRVENMRKEFLQNASHQLKTPLSIIKGYAEGLMDNVADDEESRMNYATTIYKEAEYMDSLVMKILSLARIEADGYNVKLERFDIRELIYDALGIYAPLFEQNQITPQFIQSEKFYVYADRSMIMDVISNYLTNAINHIDENKKINASIKVFKEYIRVEVYNSGKNIPEDEIENIWQSFYKLEHKEGYKGNGLGLSIVAAIMKLHNRQFGVINQDGGVVFWFELGR